MGICKRCGGKVVRTETNPGGRCACTRFVAVPADAVRSIESPPDGSRVTVTFDEALPGTWNVEMRGSARLVVTDDGIELTDTKASVLVLRMTRVKA